MAKPTHDCPYPGCDEQLPRNLLACRTHWYVVAPGTRRAVNAAWRAYRADRSIERLAEYLAVRADAIDEMRSHAA